MTRKKASENIVTAAKEPSDSQYVEHRDGGCRITGTRVSLDSVIYPFLRGASPESIAQSFPLITQVYGAIAFYLSPREEVDAYLAQGEADFDAEAGSRGVRWLAGDAIH